METNTDTNNIQTVSYKKILPKYEFWPVAADNVKYIDLQYDSTVYKLQESEDSQTKFNSLPTIKSGRRSQYISAIEAISLPKSEATADLSIDVPDTAAVTPASPVSLMSDTTTVVIHESPRGITNEAFEEDEEDGKKNVCRESPSHSSNVSYSSSDSTVHMPEVDIDAAIRKKMESEGLSKPPVIEGQLKKKWRGEKLYLTFPRGRINQEQHVARFCCWIISLILLAGALTVAALIGVGVIKLPIPDAFNDNKTNQITFVDELGPRLGYVGTEGVLDESSEKSLMEILMLSKTTTTKAPTMSNSPLTRGMLIKILTSSTSPSNPPEVPKTLLVEEHDEISTEMPSSPLPQTTETLSTTFVTLPSTSEEPSESVSIETSTDPRENHETSKSMITIAMKTLSQVEIESTENIFNFEGSGMSELLPEEGSGLDNEKNIDTDEFLLENESDTPLEVNTEAAIENNYENGSGEVELIITLPQIEGSGNEGSIFEITRPRPDSFSSGEDVFRALLDFLLPNKESDSLPDDDNITFKQVFSSIGL